MQFHNDILKISEKMNHFRFDFDNLKSVTSEYQKYIYILNSTLILVDFQSSHSLLDKIFDFFKYVLKYQETTWAMTIK